MSLIERFETLAIELKNDPAIELIIFHRQAGLAELPLEQHQLPISASLQEFYGQINGLQLVWIRKDNELYDPNIHQSRATAFDWMEMWNDDYPYDGSVILLPFEQSFGLDWKNRVWFDIEEKYPTSYLGKSMTVRDFKSRLIPFDVGNKYYSFSYYLDDPDDPYTLLLGQDYGADYISSKRLSLDQYLDLIIESKGELQHRVQQMKTTWGSLN